MERFVFINALGDAITFDYTGDYILDKYKGIESPTVEAITQEGFRQNGRSVDCLLLGTRTMNFTVVCWGEKRYEKHRELCRILSPLLGVGELYCYNNAGVRMIRCYCSTLPKPKERKGTLQFYDITFESAETPFFQDAEKHIIPLNGWEGGLTFKADFALQFATPGNTIQVKNDGDVAAGFIVRLNGLVEKPKIILQETGEHIEVNTTILDNTVMEISTIPGDYYVDNNGVSAFNHIVSSSSFFKLQPGYNTLFFDFASGVPKGELEFSNYYLGA